MTTNAPEREKGIPALLLASLRSGALVGGIAIFLVLLGLQKALWMVKLGPVSLGDVILVLLAMWSGYRIARKQQLSTVTALLCGAGAGLVAGAIYASLVSLAVTFNLGDAFDNLRPDSRPALTWQRSLSVAWAIALLGGALLGAFATILPKPLEAGNASLRKLSNNAGKMPALNRSLLGLALAFLLFAPPFIGPYWNQILGSVGIYVLMGLGLNVVVGFAGLLDLGYVAFYAIGAYTYAFLSAPKYGMAMPFWVGILGGMLVACFMGVLLGIPVLRMRGDYLAIVTLGFGEIIRLFMNNLVTVTGGPQGVLQIASPSIFGWVIDRPTEYYYLILVGCLLVAFITSRLNHSRIGRAWIAMREDEDVARAMGINTVIYRLLAFATGASFAGMGGVIFASRQHAIFPNDFVLMVSVNVLCLIIIGGLGSIPGVIVGSIVLVGLPEILRQFADFRLLIFGALLVLMMIARPEGLIPSKRVRLEIEEAAERGGEGPGESAKGTAEVKL